MEDELDIFSRNMVSSFGWHDLGLKEEMMALVRQQIIDLNRIYWKKADLERQRAEDQAVSTMGSKSGEGSGRDDN